MGSLNTQPAGGGAGGGGTGIISLPVTSRTKVAK
jgi:hypothetical protein